MFTSFRITQLYESGAAVYVYFSLAYNNINRDRVVDVFEEIEHRSRQAVFENGGSISHHHGVGKLRKRFMERTITGLNMKMTNALKKEVDPKNIFAINNTIYRSEEEKAFDQEYKGAT